MRNVHRIVFIFLLLAVLPHAWGAVWINEFMSSNSSAAFDEDGDSSDWLELYNDSGADIDLTGYALSDDEEDPLRWVFPSGTLPANGFFLVWASGKDRVSPGGEYHTNFAISANGEVMLLTAPDGVTLVDQSPEIPLSEDISYGRSNADIQQWLYFMEATPGAANDVPGLPELLDPPNIQLLAGYYGDSLAVQITSQYPTATILYTLDGSDPRVEHLSGNDPGYLVNTFFPGVWTESQNILRQNDSYLFAGPVVLHDPFNEGNDLSRIITTYRQYNGSYLWRDPVGTLPRAQTLRAVALVDSVYSPIATSTYFFAQHADHDLPVLSIVTDTENLFGYEQGIYVPGETYFLNGGDEENFVRPANYEWSGSSSERVVHAELFGTDHSLQWAQDVGLRIHGKGSRTLPGKGIRLYARAGLDGNNAIGYPIFPGACDAFGQPQTEYSNIMVRLGGSNQNVMLDRAVHKIMSEMEIGTQRGRPIVHYINGEYWGLACFRDYMDEDFLARKYQLDPDNLIILDAPWGPGQEYFIDTGEAEDLQFYDEFWDYVTGHDMSDSLHYTAACQMFDPLSYIDYNIAFIYMRNVDWVGCNHFEYWRCRETGPGEYQDGKWRFMVRDFDSAFMASDFDHLINFIHPDGGGNEWASNNPVQTQLLRSLLESEQFRNLFLNRIADLMNSHFTADRMQTIMQDGFDTILSELPRNNQRWSRTVPTQSFVNSCLDFAEERSFYVRQQICTHFALDGICEIELACADTSHGYLEVNTIRLQRETPGISSADEPWIGTYFQGIPVQIQAKANPGYCFDHWTGSSETSAEIVLVPGTQPLSLCAYFVPDQQPVEVLHAWNFNDLADAEIDSVYSDYSLIGSGLISYPGTGDGYMDDVDSGSSLGALPGTLAGKGLRVRNPSATRELQILTPLPTHELSELSFAVRKSNNGGDWYSLQFCTAPGEDWVAIADSVQITTDYSLQQYDLSAYPELSALPELRFRVLAHGPTTVTDEGNQRFDNIVLQGRMIAGANQPPVVVEPLPDQVLVEEEQAIHLPLSACFSDPENDTLEIEAISDATGIVLSSVIEGELVLQPVSRGSATISVEASDGEYTADFQLHVLVHPLPLHEDLSFSAWAPDTPERLYPQHMLFLQSREEDPGVNTPLTDAYFIPHDDYHEDDSASIGFPYNNTKRTRINGLGEGGIAFLNTGRDRDLGGLLLAVDTRFCDSLALSWSAGTLTEGTRGYALRLQARIGKTGPFSNVLHLGQLVEYVASVSGDSISFGPIELPESLLGEERVELLWRYYHLSGDSGSRSQIVLDDLELTGHWGSDGLMLSIQYLPSDEIQLCWEDLRPGPGVVYHIQRALTWPAQAGDYQELAVVGDTSWVDQNAVNLQMTGFYRVLREEPLPVLSR